MVKKLKEKVGSKLLLKFFIVFWLELFNTIKLLTAEADRLPRLVSNMLPLVLKALSFVALEAGKLKEF